MKKGIDILLMRLNDDQIILITMVGVYWENNRMIVLLEIYSYYKGLCVSNR